MTASSVETAEPPAAHPEVVDAPVTAELVIAPHFARAAWAGQRAPEASVVAPPTPPHPPSPTPLSRQPHLGAPVPESTAEAAPASAAPAEGAPVLGRPELRAQRRDARRLRRRYAVLALVLLGALLGATVIVLGMVR